MDYLAKFNLFINFLKFGSSDDFYQYYKNEFLEKPSDTGSRPIHLACKFQNANIVKLLIELKCNVNIADKKGMYPIHLACLTGNLEIAQLLIKAGCSIKDNFVCVRNGYYPIHFACVSGNVKLVKLLVGLKCELGATPYKLSFRPLSTAEFLINSKDSIHLACTHGCVAVLRYLLIDRNHNIEAECGITKMRSIHFACDNNNAEIVEILTEFNCDCNKRDGHKRSPLDIAIEKDNQEIINILRRVDFYNGSRLKLIVDGNRFTGNY